jgi:excisionase family DNA binding protein
MDRDRIGHAAASSGGLRTRAEAAEYLRTSERRLDELIRAGQLAAVRDGAKVKIYVSELERYIATLPAFEPASA